MNPKGKGKVPGSPAEWISHAKSDLRLAQIASKDEFVRKEQACFHAQQAGEKAIKAVLLSRKIGFPLTHDIEQLLEIAEGNGIALPEDVREASLLTPYAVESRYPGCWFEITEDDLAEAIRSAEHTLKWAERELKSSSQGVC
jgi:HEPN domain-containing protein